MAAYPQTFDRLTPWEGAAPEVVVPYTVERRRPSAGRRTTKLLALISATGVHLVIFLLVGLSLTQTQYRFATQAAGGGGVAVMASLVRGDALSPSPPTPARNDLDALARTLDAPVVAASDPQAPPSSGSKMLDEMETLAGAAPGKAQHPAPASERAGPSTGQGVALKEDFNPWAHASALAINASKTKELWSAIKPCWRGGDAGQSSIRVVLNDRGEVLEMLALGSVNPQSRSSVQALATAITGCAPYHVGPGDAYLVTGPI